MTSFPLVGTVTGAARAVYSYSQAEQISSFFSFVRLYVIYGGRGDPPPQKCSIGLPRKYNRKGK